DPGRLLRQSRRGQRGRAGRCSRGGNGFHGGCCAPREPLHSAAARSTEGVRPMKDVRLRHLLGIEGMSRETAEHILTTAESFLEISRRPVRKVPTLRGKTVLNVFFENSTRTRTSFELAGKRVGADVVNMSASSSSTKKGETLYDTMATLDAMHADVVVIRHEASGAPHLIAERSRASVVNAGDGMHEHPTQALLDAFTMRQHFGPDLSGKVVAICGDIQHSRVARSN